MTALADLGTYPEWLSLVHAAEPVDDAVWNVTLQARLGPLARSKRLRMRRTHLDETRVRFERAETDERNHADWTLEASVQPSNPQSNNALSTNAQSTNAQSTNVIVALHYGGALWSAPLEIALASFEGSAAERLSTFLADA